MESDPPDDAHPTMDELRRWAAGKLDEQRAREIADHIEGCAAVCQPLLDSLSGFEEELLSETLPGKIAAAAAIDPAGLPGFELLGLLGEGGMGQVFKARHLALKRLVALKFIGGGTARRDKLFRARLQVEAEAMAMLRHPNIVTVFEFAEGSGRPYLVMEFADGGSLGARLERSEELSVAQIAQLVELLARATQYAHERGVIHRDLKPQNILLSSEAGASESSQAGMMLWGQAWVPKVTDFGLAKFAGAAEGHMTVAGDVFGSPGYMSPEQARGDHRSIGVRTDVHALGTILYHLLTGRPPFDAPTVAEALELVRAEVPPDPPRRQRPTLPQDLDTVCMKCLQKAPGDRYATAGALADDLRRFRIGEAVSVRPAGAIEKLIRAARRKPTLAAAYALAVLTIVLGVVAVTVLSLYRSARTARYRAEAAQALLAGQKHDTESALDREKTARSNEAAARASEARAHESLARLEYARTIDLANREYRASHVARARALLATCRPDLRSWEWRYLDRLCHRESSVLPQADAGAKAPSTPQSVLSICVSPDGKLAAAACGPDVRVYRTASWKLVNTIHIVAHPRETLDFLTTAQNPLAFLYDNSTLAIATENQLGLYDALTGKAVLAFPDQHRLIASVEALRDRQHLLSADQSGLVTLWTIATGKPALQIREPDAAAAALATVSADGGLVATCGYRMYAPALSHEIHVWDANSATKLRTLFGHSGAITAIAFSTTGRTLITGAEDGVIRIWNADNGDAVRTTNAHQGVVNSICFFPDGRQFVSAGADGSVRVWSIVPDEVLGVRTRYDPVFIGHEGAVCCAAACPDGRRIISGGADQTVRIWDTITGREFVDLGPMTEKVLAMSFSPDSRAIATVPDDGAVRVWDTGTGELRHMLVNGSRAFARLSVGFGETGSRLIYANAESARVWDVEREEIVARFTTAEAPKTAPATSRSGMSPPAERAVLPKPSPPPWIDAAALADHDSRVILSTNDLRIWQGAAMAPRHVGGPAAGAMAVDISATGRYWAVAKSDGTCQVWDADAGTSVQLKGATESSALAARIAFSRDESRVALIRRDGSGRIWDRAGGQTIGSFQLVVGTGISIAEFSPDLRRAATDGAGDNAIIWDVDTGNMLLEISTESLGVASLKFSPDGSKLAVGTGKLRALIFDSDPVPRAGVP